MSIKAKKTLKAKANEKDIRLSLVANGLDFIESSLKYIIKRSTPQKNIKYAVLHLFSGVQLLLKERVRREHWSLLFSQPHQANKEKYLRGDFNGVAFDSLLQLIKEVCAVKISSESENALLGLRGWRNKAEHFEFHANSFALKAIAGRTLDFLVDFIHTELDSSSFSTEEKKEFVRIQEYLPKFEKFVLEREKRLKQSLSSYDGLVLKCAECGYRYSIRNEKTGSFACLFCFDETDDFELLAEEYIENVHGISSYSTAKDGIEWPQYDCPDCGEYTLVQKGPSYEDGYVCISCDTHYKSSEIHFCSRCGTLVAGEGAVCDDCFSFLRSDDD